MGEAIPSGMGGKKTSEFIEVILPAIVNAVVMFFVARFGIDPEANAVTGAMVAVLVAFATFALQKLARFVYGNYRKNRDYGKYEGRWLQVLPERKDFPYTIFDLKYDKDEGKYVIEGYNFHKSLSVRGYQFRAYRLVERSKKDGFYYITDRTYSGKIGLGKLIYEGKSDGLTRAVGFFCDVDNSHDAKKYEMIMVKCDDAFCEKACGGSLNARKLVKEDRSDVLRLCKEFADQEIEGYWTREVKIAAAGK